MIHLSFMKKIDPSVFYSTLGVLNSIGIVAIGTSNLGKALFQYLYALFMALFQYLTTHLYFRKACYSFSHNFSLTR